MQDSDGPDAKKPCKGILKSSSSFDKPGACHRKSAKFDELNVLQTLHPPGKDYGHMKIDEPKTPFNYAEADPEHSDQLDADLLAEKLRIAANTQTPSFGGDDNLSDDEFPETEEEKIRRIEFERRRKAHYKEFDAVKLARKLIEEEIDDDDDEDEEEAAEEFGATNSLKSPPEYSSEGRKRTSNKDDPKTAAEGACAAVSPGSSKASLKPI